MCQELTEAMVVNIYQIAGINFRLEFNVEPFLPRVQVASFRQFRSEAENADVLFQLHKVRAASLTERPLSIREQGCFPPGKLYLAPGGVNSPLLRSPQVLAKIRTYSDISDRVSIWIDRDMVALRDFTRNELYLFYTEAFRGGDKEGQTQSPEHYIGANFRQMFSYFLPNFSAILVHCAGVIRNGKVILFLAADGGGKTTVARLSKDGHILSDDQVILRRKEAKSIVAHGTPLGTMTSGPYQSSIKGIFFLEQAESFELSPIQPVDVVQCLWTEHINYTFFLPKDLKKRAFNILYDVCHQVPIYRMRFPRNYMDWDAIDRAMQT